MFRKVTLSIILFTVLFFIYGCTNSTYPTNVGTTTAPTPSPAAADDEYDLRIYCSHPESISKPMIHQFEDDNHVSIKLTTAGTGELLSELDNNFSTTPADIVWGGTVEVLSTYSNLFATYQTPNEEFIIPKYQNTSGKVTAFSIVPSVLIVNTSLAKGIPITGYKDLLNPKLKGSIAVADPNNSSSGYEHIINIMNAMSDGKPQNRWDYITDLVDNIGDEMLSSSTDVYTDVANGDYTVGLTYESAAVKSKADGYPVETVYMKEGVIARADGIALLKNATNVKLAKQFIYYVTSTEAQTMLVNSMYRRTIRSDINVNGILKPYNEINILTDDAVQSAKNKDSILKSFTELFYKKKVTNP